MHRFPANCAQLFAAAEEAVAAADADRHLVPSRVYGASRSAEGFRLYHLLEWL